MKASSSSKKAPVLKQFAALWTLEQQPSAARPWTLEQKVLQAKKEGFQAIGGGDLIQASGLARKHGLDYVAFIFPNAQNYAAQLEAAHAVRPDRVDVQLAAHDTTPREAVRVWSKMEVLAQKMGLEIDLEIHRATVTETPEKVAEIAALYYKTTGKRIRFCWDFSHLAVVKHLNPPYADRLLVHPELVQHARQFHFRPFNGHHCQIPATDGKGGENPELAPYVEFLDAIIGCWFAGAKGGETIYACPEFGPVSSGYGLAAFPNVWKDALLIREKTEAIWKKHLRRWKK